MILAFVVMGSVWGIALLLRKYVFENSSVLLAAILAISFALIGAVIQVFVAASIDENASIDSDGFGYIRNAFLTLCISGYAAYTALREK